MTSTPQQLLSRAKAETGLSDMGPDGWQEGLNQIMRAIGADLSRDADGAARVEAIIYGRIVTRLRIEAWRAAHVKDASHPVEGALFIIGLPRTATTATHFLLSNDPQFRYLRRWERDAPVPPPVFATEKSDPRRPTEQAAASVMHIADIDGPVEDGPLFGYSFSGEPGLPLPSYLEWWRNASLEAAVAYHERVLQILHAYRPPRTWLLKYPNFAYMLPELAARYPNAKFVMTHRDPLALIPSTCSVMINARRKRIPDWTPEDPTAFGLEVLRHQAEAAQRITDARALLGEHRFLDVAQREMEQDVVGVAQRIYDFAGMELNSDMRSTMREWGGRNQRGARGEHKYSAEQYGLNNTQIKNAFSDYLNAYRRYCA